MKNMTKKEAVKLWVSRDFNNIPASIFEKLADSDFYLRDYDSDTLRILASPRITCTYCDCIYEGELSLEELQLNEKTVCQNCDGNTGDSWYIGFPEYAFPCGWGTLFNPSENIDIEWFKENADEIAKLGFYIFESDDFGILLGIDAGGFDFYEVYWTPLYELRGLKWHKEKK